MVDELAFVLSEVLRGSSPTTEVKMLGEDDYR
jgi:hypothetical protein